MAGFPNRSMFEIFTPPEAFVNMGIVTVTLRPQPVARPAGCSHGPSQGRDQRSQLPEASAPWAPAQVPLALMDVPLGPGKIIVMEPFPRAGNWGKKCLFCLPLPGLFLLRKWTHRVTHIHRKPDRLAAPPFGNPSSTGGDVPARPVWCGAGCFLCRVQPPEVPQMVCGPSLGLLSNPLRFSSYKDAESKC